ncbi:MAG: GC-type dockerin domain-anchored protein [Planctomycetota bacterium]|nr:GC-type dockerin domain-anchored protein [Planctomycetota bacterium]
MNRNALRCVLASLAPVAVSTIATPTASAQVISQSYFIQHNFTFFPGGNLLPSVVGRWYDHAWIREPGHNVFSVSPAAQPGPWAAFGFDWLVFGGNVFNSGGVFCNRGAVGFGPAGGTRVDLANVPLGPSSAFARSTIRVNPFGVGTPVSGFVRSEGNVTVVGRGNSGWSFSTATVEVRARRMFFGRILWGPVLRDTVGGSALVRVDPIIARVRNADGQVTLESSLLDIKSRVDGPPFGLPENAGISWENNIATITAPEAELRIDLPGEFTPQRGSLNIQVRNGALELVERTGIFQNIQLPPPGTPIPFEFFLPSEIAIDFNLPQTLGDDVEFDMGGGSNETPIDGVPCIADFNGDGQVDFFDFLDFSLAFSEEDPSADINNDGVIDFFDYLDFAQAFDQGCD